MRILLLSIALGFISIFSALPTVSAADAVHSGSVSNTNSSTTSDSLTIHQIESVDANILRVIFSLPVDVDSIRVTLTDSLTRASLRVIEYRGVPDNTRAVDITVDSALKNDSTYILTVNTAISTTGKTISAGVDAIREFVASIPSAPLSGATIDSTPVDEGLSQGVSWLEETQQISSGVATPTEITAEWSTGGLVDTSDENDAQENTVSANQLPETGVNILWVMIPVLCILFAAILMRRRA